MNIEQQQQRHKKNTNQSQKRVVRATGRNKLRQNKQTNKKRTNTRQRQTTARRGQVSWLEAKDFFPSGDQDKHINKKIRK